MKNIICSLALLLSVSILNADHHKKDESNLKLPTSWKEYLSLKKKQKAFGIWTYRGRTSSMWEGIPEAIEYSHTHTLQMSANGSKILSSEVMKTKDGAILSTGTGMETWDAKRKKIFSSHSGYDGGKLYTGPSELIGIGESAEKWKYTETSSGKTYEVIVTRKTKALNKRSHTFMRVKNPDSSTTSTFTRQPKKKTKK
tara:strand:- start:280 stop:873 length:594 start_codon:yes stop_codon:yes gene_type:complete